MSACDSLRKFRLRHWLIAHSALYRRWIRWRFKRSMRRMEKAIGSKLLPALNSATAAMEEWLRAR